MYTRFSKHLITITYESVPCCMYNLSVILIILIDFSTCCSFVLHVIVCLFTVPAEHLSTINSKQMALMTATLLFNYIHM